MSETGERPDAPRDEEHRNEGEGSRTAARRYGEGVRRHIEQGRTEAEAESAERALEADPEDLERAEREGKAKSAGEAPGDLE
ncbi:MAG: hypothetical protein QM704_21660 [Anaeromyxobacteraceae bacterium]